ncbi:DoxX family protein [Flavihumibacter petaseus]|uniref:DoxX family protein n=1 Tax=Flavihumibacter petaseus NBRC 106054 TaxID=1220578 RepID=A0A0E9MXR7_9BACT|nr:DoxX family protein [Flavihumibacter petaseus]GAO41910.1 hypothetical protein FPE01S_01_09250 [Flavihumibacter petaseus NBRC 106054]
MSTLHAILRTDGAASTILVRLMVGAVFLSEGIQKFLFPEKLGSGRFRDIGLSLPEIFGPLVGVTELICGLMVLLGCFTRMAAIPLTLIMIVAMVTTKQAIFVKAGFWQVLHDSRTDWAMLLGSIFLFIEGGGKWSLDHQVQHRR